ncbi:MFS transporter [Nocardia sp. NPDC060220]|uniref:MFS transporter n=1 Tax=Nocardia sp. NPDC060220 TaxID=3347076 RepID=UPI003657C298
MRREQGRRRLPSIRAETGGSMAALQWLVNVYTIPLAALLLSAGTLADRLGARRVFAWALGGFTVASLICAVSATLPVLLAARCFQGIFAAPGDRGSGDTRRRSDRRW